MRIKDVDAFIEHASTDLVKIEKQYTHALSQKEVPRSLLIDIKNFMENLRSALDYIAHDIYEVLIKKEGEKIIERVYFPYGKTESSFESNLDSNLPDLKILNPNIYTLIKSVQPHQCQDDWLYNFCCILNEKKHDTLSPQIKNERQTMTASTNELSVTMPINNPNFSVYQGADVQVMIGGIPVRFTNEGIIPLAPGLECAVTTWVSFLFAETNIEVLPLLRKAQKEISELSEKVYLELSKQNLDG